MAFNTNTAPANNVSPFSSEAGAQPRRQQRPNPAAGFLNIYIPTKNGGRRKLGYIVLSSERAFEADIAEKLKNDPALVDKLAGLIEVEFNTSEADENSFADL